MNLRRILHVFASGLRVTARDKATLFWAFVFPVALLLLFGTILGTARFGEPGRSIPLHVADADGGEPSPLQSDFVHRLGQAGWNPEWVPAHVPPDDQFSYVLEASSRSFRTPRLLVLPADFDERVRAGNTSQLRVTAEGDSPVVGMLLGSATQVASGLYGEHAGANTSQPQQPVTLQVQSAAAGGNGASSFYLPNLVAMNLLFAGMIGGTSTYAGTRSTSTIKRLIASPVTKHEWVTGTLLGLLLSMSVSVTLLILVGHFAYGLHTTVSPLVVLLVVAGLLLMFGIGVLFARTFKEPLRAVQFSTGITLILLFLSGYFLPTEFYPGILQDIVRFLPTTHLGDALRLTMTYASPQAALVPALVVVGSAAVVLPLALLNIRWRWD